MRFNKNDIVTMIKTRPTMKIFVRLLQTYYDSMAKLQLLTDEELKQIFGPITTLVPLHEEVVESLRDQRLQDGTTDSIGKVLLEWVHRLREYIPYCANQVYARALLDVKRQEPAIEDFLQRCQDSPFSRRLDLWSFLGKHHEFRLLICY